MKGPAEAEEGLCTHWLGILGRGPSGPLAAWELGFGVSSFTLSRMPVRQFRACPLTYDSPKVPPSSKVLGSVTSLHRPCPPWSRAGRMLGVLQELWGSPCRASGHHGSLPRPWLSVSPPLLRVLGHPCLRS